jgi:hypothetical protein
VGPRFQATRCQDAENKILAQDFLLATPTHSLSHSLTYSQFYIYSISFSMSTVSVTVPGSGPYGITIESDRFGHAAVLKSWVRLPTGKFGAVQKHGGVSLGDVLVAVNDVSVVNAPFADVKAMLGKSGSGSGTAVKVLKFQSSAEYYGKK